MTVNSKDKQEYKILWMFRIFLKGFLRVLILIIFSFVKKRSKSEGGDYWIAHPKIIDTAHHTSWSLWKHHESVDINMIKFILVVHLSEIKKNMFCTQIKRRFDHTNLDILINNFTWQSGTPVIGLSLIFFSFFLNNTNLYVQVFNPQ